VVFSTIGVAELAIGVARFIANTVRTTSIDRAFELIDILLDERVDLRRVRPCIDSVDGALSVAVRGRSGKPLYCASWQKRRASRVAVAGVFSCGSIVELTHVDGARARVEPDIVRRADLDDRERHYPANIVVEIAVVSVSDEGEIRSNIGWTVVHRLTKKRRRLGRCVSAEVENREIVVQCVVIE
jgi:hypothetical protein